MDQEILLAMLFTYAFSQRLIFSVPDQSVKIMRLENLVLYNVRYIQDRTHTPWPTSCVPWEKLSLAIQRPISMSETSLSTSLVAGPVSYIIGWELQYIHMHISLSTLVLNTSYIGMANGTIHFKNPSFTFSITCP